LSLPLQELEDRVVLTLLGQQLFPSDNPWNQNISNAPVATNSAAIIAHIGASIHLHPDWGADSPANGNNPLYGIPFNIVHGNTTAKVNVIIDNYPGESDITPVPIPANAVIEGDYQNGPNPNGAGYNPGQRGDSHMIIWDEDTNIAYELGGVSRPSDPTLAPDTSGVELPHTDGLWHAGQETVWNMNTDTFRAIGETSADAAGLSILAGLVRPDEGLPVSQGGQGAIDHPLRFTLPSGDVNPQYVYPASHEVGTPQGADNLPFGARLRLANTPAINSLISNMPPESQIIARAMQQYGLILADIGGAMFITGSSATVDNVDPPNLDLTWNLNDIFASNGLSVLDAGDFQVVNLTPVVTGLSETSGSAGDAITITGQNFSGAAGQLSVFFGSTAASSVTYVSDSHITAIVPNGAGTVNVAVQSGVDETDNFSDNPNSNVNKPVFGYGVSAVTAADQFTYGGQTISPTYSTASFASSTDGSGATDLLSIVVKDTSGSAVSGLSNSAFSFSLAGGTSAGTFGAVSATATPGTYTDIFTGTTAGTSSTLTVTVSGVAISTKPAVQVTAGSVSATTSTASFASPTVAAGATDLLTLKVKDAAGNAIAGLASSAFSLTLAGGVSAGTFGAVSATSTAGTYTVVFTGTTSGTASTLTAKVSGVTLNSKPTVQVIAGGVSGAKSTISLATSTVASGSTDVITVAVKDNNGNPIAGLANGAFSFALAGGVSAGTFGAVSATSTAGTYTVVFTGTTAGTASTLTTKVSGVTLSTQPTVQVTPGSVSATSSTASFASPTVAAGATDLLTVVVKDAAGNAISGLASSAFSFTLAGGVSAGTFGAVAATSTPGTYTALFTGTTAGTASTLTAKVSGVTLNTKPTVQVIAGGVSGAKSTVSLATPTVTSGSTDVITIAVKDNNGNAITGLANNAFSFTLSGGVSGGTFGAVSASTTPGTYTVVFTGTTVGTASTLTAKVSGVTINTTPTVQVVAGGVVSGAKSTIRFATPTVAVGGTDVITIAVKDSNGVPIAGLASSAFSFALKAGTSAGTFSAVSATSTAGTYTAVFTGTTAGSLSILIGKVNGVTINIAPAVEVVASGVSGAKSALRLAAPTVSRGRTDVITIAVKNNKGNPITGLPSEAFSFALARGKSAGDFGSVSATTTPGIYKVVFTGTMAGTASRLTAKVRGVKLGTKPKLHVVARASQREIHVVWRQGPHSSPRLDQRGPR
jgi:hypothetical protein